MMNELGTSGSKRANLTIVFAFRDRGLDRVDRCISSLASQSCQKFVVHFVDYGSRTSVSRDLQKLFVQYPFVTYFHSETRGQPFNKSRALNIGIRAADTDYVMNGDVDIVFASNFIQTALERVDANKALYCAPHLLPEQFDDWDHVNSYKGRFPTDKTMIGTCQIYPLWAIRKLQGFDELMLAWYEDTDVQERLQQLGLEESWLDEYTATFHQWHSRALRAYTYISTTLMPYVKSVADRPVRNETGWGESTRRDQRPILQKLEPEDEAFVSIPEWLSLLLYTSPPGSSSWLITDRLGADAIYGSPPGLHTRYIRPHCVTSILRSQRSNEDRLAKDISAALLSLSSKSQALPMIVILELAAYLRISSAAFAAVMDSIPVGGFVVFLGYNTMRRPAALNTVARICLPVLRRLYESTRHAPQPARAMRVKINASLCGESIHVTERKPAPLHLAAARTLWLANRRLRQTVRNRTLESILFLNHNLRDSLIPLILTSSHIDDMYIDFPAEGQPNILMKK